MENKQLTDEQKKALVKTVTDVIKKIWDGVLVVVRKFRQYMLVAWNVEKMCQFSSSTIVYSNNGVFDSSICTKAGDIIRTACALIPKELDDKRWRYEIFIKLLVLLRFRVLTKNDVYSVFNFDKYGQSGPMHDLYKAVIQANEAMMFAGWEANPGMDDKKIPASKYDSLLWYREAMVITQLSIAHHMLKASDGDVRQHITMEAYKIHTITESFWWPLVLSELNPDNRHEEPYFTWPVWLTDEQRYSSLDTACVISPYIRSLSFFIETHIDPYYKSSE